MLADTNFLIDVMTNNVAAVKKAKVFCAINRVAILAHDDAKIS